MSEVELMLRQRNREKTMLSPDEAQDRRSAKVRRQIDENISSAKKELQELKIRTTTPPPRIGRSHSFSVGSAPQTPHEGLGRDTIKVPPSERRQLSPDNRSHTSKQARMSLPQPLLGDATPVHMREKRPSMPREGMKPIITKDGRVLLIKEDKQLDVNAEPMKAKTRMNLKLSEKLTQSICKSSERRGEGTPVRLRSLSPRCLEDLQKAATVLRNTEHEGMLNDLMMSLKTRGIETKAPGKS